MSQKQKVIVPYLGGTIKFSPAGMGKIEGENRSWDESVKVFQDRGQGPAVLSVSAAAALVKAAEERLDVREFLGLA